MSEQKNCKTEDILKPIVTLMKFFGFNQIMPKQKMKYFSIQFIRLLIVFTVIKIIVAQFINSMALNDYKAFVNWIHVLTDVSLTSLLLYSNKIQLTFDETIVLSTKSYKKLKIISRILLGFLLITHFIVIITDLIKLFYFDNWYILVFLNQNKIERTKFTSYLTFIFSSIQYFTFISFPRELWCIYCSITCLVISKMFEDLNKNILAKKFKMTLTDLHRIKLIHHKIKGQAINFSNVVSIPVLIIFYKIISSLCYFTFHIISYIRDPINSG